MESPMLNLQLLGPPQYKPSHAHASDSAASVAAFFCVAVIPAALHSTSCCGAPLHLCCVCTSPTCHHLLVRPLLVPHTPPCWETSRGCLGAHCWT